MMCISFGVFLTFLLYFTSLTRISDYLSVFVSTINNFKWKLNLRSYFFSFTGKFNQLDVKKAVQMIVITNDATFLHSNISAKKQTAQDCKTMLLVYAFTTIN